MLYFKDYHGQFDFSEILPVLVKRVFLQIYNLRLFKHGRNIFFLICKSACSIPQTNSKHNINRSMFVIVLVNVSLF